MYHPDLREIFFKSSSLNINNPVSVVVLSPLEKNKIDVNMYVEQEVYNKHLGITFGHFSGFDPRYEFGLDNMYSLRRWLYFNLLADRKKPRIKPKTEKEIQKVTGKKPTGIKELW